LSECKVSIVLVLQYVIWMRTTTLSATTTIMADIKLIEVTQVWCLLIDHNYKPTLEEPFPVSLLPVDTIHVLKFTIFEEHMERRSHPAVPYANSLGIWKCKNPKLSAKDPFSQTKEQLDEIRFSGDWKGRVQHLGVAQRVKELELEGDELLLVVMP